MKEDEDGRYVYSHSQYTWINMTRLLGVDGIIGMKPGWTPAASHCLAINYEKDDHTFIVVTI